MQILSEEDAIREAQAAFEEVVAAESERVATTIGHPAGQLPTSVHWISRVDLWAYFGRPASEKSAGSRYWNAFGFGRPGTTVSIACEINPPIRGIDRRPGGAFAEADGIHVLHRGTFNAFRGRIPREFVHQRFQGTWVSVRDGDRESRFLKIGRLSDSSFIDDLCDFVAEVQRLKVAFKE